MGRHSYDRSPRRRRSSPPSSKRSQRYRSRSPARSRTPPRTSFRQDSHVSKLPQNWNPDAQQLDTSKQYGLSLPRHVVSNRLTREQGTAGMDVQEIPLKAVIHDGISNWGLRAVANGRTTVWEYFRSRQEAVFAGTLVRKLRGSQGASSSSSDNVGSGPDLNAIWLSQQQILHPGSDMHQWDNRYKAILHVAEIAAKALRDLAPDTTHQQMLSELDKLRKENASLKATGKVPYRPTPPLPPGVYRCPPRKQPRPSQRTRDNNPSKKRW